MNYKQIQLDLIKEAFKKHPERRIMYKDVENKRFYVTDGFCCYVMPLYNCFIDVPGIVDIAMQKYCVDWRNDEKLLNIIARCVGGENEYFPAELSNNRIKTENDKTLAIIENKDTTVYINENFLKYFDSDCTFEIKNNVSCVRVIENYNLAGIIMPIRYNPKTV